MRLPALSAGLARNFEPCWPFEPQLNASAHEEAIDERAREERTAYEAKRLERLSGHAERIARELHGTPEILKSTRGSPRPVLCLSRYGVDGLPLSYPTVSAAAAEVGARAHHIRRACLGRGKGSAAKCRGHVYAYADEFEPAAAPRYPEVMSTAKKKTPASPAPPPPSIATSDPKRLIGEVEGIWVEVTGLLKIADGELEELRAKVQEASDRKAAIVRRIERMHAAMRQANGSPQE